MTITLLNFQWFAQILYLQEDLKILETENMRPSSLWKLRYPQRDTRGLPDPLDPLRLFQTLLETGK